MGLEDNGVKEEWLSRAVDGLIVVAIFSIKGVVALGGVQAALMG